MHNNSLVHDLKLPMCIRCKLKPAYINPINNCQLKFCSRECRYQLANPQQVNDEITQSKNYNHKYSNPATVSGNLSINNANIPPCNDISSRDFSQQDYSKSSYNNIFKTFVEQTNSSSYDDTELNNIMSKYLIDLWDTC